MLHRRPSIEKIRSAVGWEPTRTLDEILRDVVSTARSAPVLPEPETV
jgi:nucleoside-diphosphate-sugar epimerase